MTFLENNLKMPCYLLGSKHFMVEDAIFSESWNINEYRKLKSIKNKAVLELINFNIDFEYITDNDIKEIGIQIEAKHISDNEWEDGDEYILRLFEFIAKDAHNFELLDDYANWFLNYSDYFNNVSRYTI